MPRAGEGDAGRKQCVELIGLPAQRRERLCKILLGGGDRARGTLVSVAVGAWPPGSSLTSRRTNPARVCSPSVPNPWRWAHATPVAIVACPQKGTSATGLKYRTSSSSPVVVGVTKPVSENPTSCAMACIVAASRPEASRTTPAGLLPEGSSLKAA